MSFQDLDDWEALVPVRGSEREWKDGGGKNKSWYKQQQNNPLQIEDRNRSIMFQAGEST